MARKEDAEAIFRKSEEEMSDIERMMAEILGEEAQKKEENPFELGDLERSKSEAPVNFDSPVPPEKRKKSANREFSHEGNAKKGRKSAPTAMETETMPRRERTRKPEKKKSSVPLVLLLLIALLVVGVLVYSKVFRDFQASMPGAAGRVDNRSTISAQTDEPTEEEVAAMAAITFPPDMVFPTPEPEDTLSTDGTIRAEAPSGSIVIMSGTEERKENLEGQTEQEVEHSYQFIREDLSWTQAQERCKELGGHLAVISNEDELQEIIALAAANGIQKVWIGCHRENGELVWENGETVDYYVWGKGEPSYVDGGDHVAEDYLLLWRFNGAWVYNDSRNDPVKDYPDMYSGQIGFVCEFGK